MGWTPNHRYEERAGGYGRTDSSRFNSDRRDDRHEGGGRELRRDNGWESRKQSNAAQGWDEPPSKGWGPGRGDTSAAREDRSWAPSASWQPGHREREGPFSSASNQRSQNGGSKSKGKNKGNKKGGRQPPPQQQPKRSWRDDDSHLNKYVGFPNHLGVMGFTSFTAFR